MTQTFIVIRNNATKKNHLFRKSGALTRGFYECPIYQLFITEKYPIQMYDEMITRLEKEEWEDCDLHPAELLEWAEKLLYIQYEEGGEVVVKVIFE